jgi:uncharacterized protein
MIGDQLCTTSWRASPGSFVALMTLYESNYIRLRWLLNGADPAQLPASGAASVVGDAELSYEVLERGPYTTLLRLQYRALGKAAEGLPSVRVCVYHDARVVEAAAVEIDPKPRRALPVDGEALSPRWARNVLLNKWLEYCAERGYRFGAV